MKSSLDAEPLPSSPSKTQEGVLYTARSFSYITDEKLIALWFSLDQVVRVRENYENTVIIMERAVDITVPAVDGPGIHLHSSEKLGDSESDSAPATSEFEEDRQNNCCSIC